jgi:hypothetical protein
MDQANKMDGTGLSKFSLSCQWLIMDFLDGKKLETLGMSISGILANFVPKNCKPFTDHRLGLRLRFAYQLNYLFL